MQIARSHNSLRCQLEYASFRAKRSKFRLKQPASYLLRVNTTSSFEHTVLSRQIERACYTNEFYDIKFYRVFKNAELYHTAMFILFVY